MSEVESVAIVGAGTMGAGIAGVFAERSYRVAVFSRSEDTIETARRHLDHLAASVRFTTCLEECLEGATIVSENLAEDVDLKQHLFARIEQLVAADCLLTTNTSSVPIGTVAERMDRPARLVGMHWFNPPAVMPLVEIVRGPQTHDETVVRARELASALGKDTIEVRVALPGFVVNRLQYAMMREAAYLVEAGIATAADVDRAVETTLAPRWSSAGPLKLMDLAGLDTVAKVSAILIPALCNAEGISPLVSRLVGEGAFGTKSGRGFYDWSPETAAEAKADRDNVVRLLNVRRH